MELEFKHRIQHCGMLRGHLRTSGALATAALATAALAAALAPNSALAAAIAASAADTTAHVQLPLLEVLLHC